MAWAREQPDPKPSWLLPWEELTEPEREVDRRIGHQLYALGVADGIVSLGQIQASRWEELSDGDAGSDARGGATTTGARRSSGWSGGRGMSKRKAAAVPGVYSDGRERLEFVDLHGAFAVKLDGESIGLPVFGVYDVAILRGMVIACPARPGGWGADGPPLMLYRGDGTWSRLVCEGEGQL